MARVKATVCECNERMKRLYVRADGGKGWEPKGWLCECGCICMDEGHWQVINCEGKDCIENGACVSDCTPADDEHASDCCDTPSTTSCC